MSENQTEDINNDKFVLVKHPLFVQFRQALFEYKMRRSQEEGKPVPSYKIAAELGFVSHVHFNQLENGKKTCSIETMVVVLDRMGYKIELVRQT